MIVVSPTNAQVQTCLRNFLLSVLAAGIEVVQGQDNRVPEPSGDDFVVITLLRQAELMTRVDSDQDSVFVGSISGNVLTVSSFTWGAPLAVGRPIYGVGVASGTQIVSLGTGSGGVGTYNLNNTQTIGSETLAAGTMSSQYDNEIVYQIDVHGPNSVDNATIIAGLLRDDYCCQNFGLTLGTLGFSDGSLVQPLYCDDPQQRPFVNDQNQVENRWSIDAHINANQTVLNIPQQYGNIFTPQMISVDATYPPTSVL